MFLSKDFSFDAAHQLTRYHGKCERLHGHTYKLRVTVEGEVQENGLVLDFVILKKLVKERVIDRYDHQNLNDFFENPTAELVCRSIWESLVDLPALLRAEAADPNLPDEVRRLLQEEGVKEISQAVRLHEVTLWETPESFVTCRGLTARGTSSY